MIGLAEKREARFLWFHLAEKREAQCLFYREEEGLESFASFLPGVEIISTEDFVHFLQEACSQDAGSAATFSHQFVGDGIGSTNLEPAFRSIVLTWLEQDDERLFLHVAKIGRQIEGSSALEVVTYFAVRDVLSHSCE